MIKEVTSPSFSKSAQAHMVRDRSCMASSRIVRGTQAAGGLVKSVFVFAVC